MNVHIIGAATTKFGELWETSPRVLAMEAATNALKEAGITKSSIEALYVGNMLSGILGGQEHIGAFFAEELGLTSSASKVEGACASGGLAVHAGVLAVLSGQYETVMVLGTEKMTDHKPEDVAVALMGAGSEEERVAGATFPGLYAILARAHMETFGTTPEQLASVAVKNHHHAMFNPHAQFHSALTIEKVLNSSLVSDPLHLLECSPISDGAAAIILSSKPQKDGVVIAASKVATGSLGLSGRQSLTELAVTKLASKQAYDDAGIEPKDIDLAEVHDCFTIAEIMALEDLGFYEKGEAAEAIARGQVTMGTSKRLVVNTSGGLKGCGHPVGATGIKQVVEIYDQLMGKAGKRQIVGARIGLTQNVGGSGATAVVHVLKKA